MKRFKRMANKLIPLLLIAALALFPLTGCSKGQENIQAVKNVKVTEAKKTSISISVEYAGKVAPVEEVSIASKLPGRVQLVKADVGSEVQQGDLLFQLDTRSANAQLSQSKAAVDNAHAGLVKATDSSILTEVLKLEAAAQQAQLQYDDAKRGYERTQALYSTEAVSKKDLESAETQFKNAEIQLKSAKDNLKTLKEKTTPQTAAVASAQLEQARASYETASIQVSDSSVTSPIAGVVSMRNVDEGEFVSSGMPAFTVINAKTVIITVSVPDTTIEKLHTGQQVPVKITALPKSEFTCTIDTISPAADPRTLAYAVKLRLENPDNLIKPGMLAKVFLPLESKKGILTVPNEAIIVEDSIQYVFIVKDGKVKKVRISTGLSNEKITEVVEGMAEGAAIITEGQSFLNDGEQVNISK
jgi:HlyD family secretion protein